MSGILWTKTKKPDLTKEEVNMVETDSIIKDKEILAEKIVKITKETNDEVHEESNEELSDGDGEKSDKNKNDNENEDKKDEDDREDEDKKDDDDEDKKDDDDDDEDKKDDDDDDDDEEYIEDQIITSICEKIDDTKLYALSINDIPYVYVKSEEEVEKLMWNVSKKICQKESAFFRKLLIEHVDSNTISIISSNVLYLFNYHRTLHTIRYDPIEQVKVL